MEETVERVTPGTESWDLYGSEHMQRYEYFSSFYGGKRVIDAACGTGYGTSYIADQGAVSALGIDISTEAIQFCTAHYRKTNLNYLQADIANLRDSKTSADLVVSFETIEHLADPEKFIRDVSGLLGKDGMFICSTPNKKRLSGAGNINPFHPSELDWEEFKHIFEKYFDIEACYHQSETFEYLRYLEIRHLLHQQESRMNAYVGNRMERAIRKILRRPFKPIPFIHENLVDQQKGDIRIEPLDRPEAWHKTFIIRAKVKTKK
jgi:2-polyprenyl-3-methyl-5-hydroxy-6-metoxy-1,4-benzoquinol methylase